MTDPKPAKKKGPAKANMAPIAQDDKLTHEQEEFCKLYVQTNHKGPSYRDAYNAHHQDEKVVWRRATKLLMFPKIIDRIEELRERALEKHDVTVESLLRELEEARKAALSAETAQASAAVAATMGKAKITGLEKSKVELTGADGAALMPSRIELVAPNVNIPD